MNELENKTYEISAKSLTDTLNYLATRPYSEVALIITVLLKQIEAGNAKDKASGVHDEQRKTTESTK